MPQRTLALLVSATAVLAAPALGQEAAPAKKEAALFASHDVLAFRLESDLGAVFKERSQESTYHPATLTYAGPEGTPVTVNLQIKTRGNFRLQSKICNFPPLRLDFPKDSVKHTVFAGQDKLKLTVHCQDGKSRYEQSVLLEYLIYRAFNQLTDKSFRARPAHVTYVDAAGKRDSLTRYAFFIEDNDEMAKRLGATVLDMQEIHDENTDHEQITLVSLFEYFIGNTDWSVWALHNIVLTIPENSQTPLAVPYDFDWSGVIDAPYAFPDARLPIKRVRERLYRGYCRTEAELAPVFKLFNDKQEAIYDLYRSQEGLDPKIRDDVLKYYDEFYKTINDPKAVDREFIRNCRKVGAAGGQRAPAVGPQ